MGGQGTVRRDGVPAPILVGTAAHQVVLLTVAAIYERTVAHPTGNVLPWPHRSLLRHVLARVNPIDALAAKLGVSRVKHPDQSVITLRFDECQVRYMPLQTLAGRRVD